MQYAYWHQFSRWISVNLNCWASNEILGKYNMQRIFFVDQNRQFCCIVYQSGSHNCSFGFMDAFLHVGREEKCFLVSWIQYYCIFFVRNRCNLFAILHSALKILMRLLIFILMEAVRSRRKWLVWLQSESLAGSSVRMLLAALTDIEAYLSR